MQRASAATSARPPNSSPHSPSALLGSSETAVQAAAALGRSLSRAQTVSRLEMASSSNVLGVAATLRSMAQGRAGSKRLRDKFAAEGCITIACHNEKGGVGKSAHATLLAAMLAKQGFRVAIIDADPQLNQSIMWADDEDAAGHEVEDGEGSLDSSSEEEEEEEAGAAGGAAFRLPRVHGDRLAGGMDSMHPDVMKGAFDKLMSSDNLYDALNNIGLSNDASYVPKLIPCNADDYEGRLIMLAGSPELFRFNDSLVANERNDMAGRVFGAFVKLMRALAAENKLDFIIVDLGPHTDTLHKVIVSSCDYIQMVVDASVGAWGSTYAMLTQTLPDWVEWREGFRPRASRLDDSYRLPDSFPRILPVLGLKHSTRKDTRVVWSSSNLYGSMAATMSFEHVPPEVKALYQPCDDGAGGDCMFIPFLKYLEHLPAAQETGRAFFDLTLKSMKDYYHKNIRQFNREEVDKERKYCDKRYLSLAKAMAALREEHLRREEEKLQQQQQQDLGQVAGPSGSGKRRKK